jgi:DNA repair exonuclease SbcCD ATPase subunit
MGEPLFPATAATDKIFFELDRFEHAGDDRLELSGRWYGVRGRRFVRPTLTLTAGEEKLRALADLEHKPWAAEEGEQWQAVFHCEAQEFVDAQLAVAPDIAVRLPAPGSNGAAPRRLEATRPKRRRARTKPPARPAAESTRNSKPASDELADLRAEAQRLRTELESSQAAHAELKAAFERRDVVVKELREALSTRLEDQQEPMRTGQDRRRELQDRQTALEERERALADRERELSDRDRSLADRERELSGGDRHLTRLQTELEKRDRALAEREAALEQRDQALVEKAGALEERERELAERSAHAPVSVRPAPRLDASPSRRSPATTWLQRAFAVLFLLVPLLAVAVLTKLI